MSASRVKLVLGVGEGKVRVVRCIEQRVCKVLEERGYLRDGVLSPLEAAFMLARCTAELEGIGCGWVVALEVASLYGPAEVFFVYYDLRRRGRLVFPGIRRGTLLVNYGRGRRVEVKILVEGGLVSVGELLEWSRTAAGDDKEPVIAVVSGHGDVTYYSARAVRGFT